METMPKSITASTGMDALTHALECLITKGATQLSDMFALEAAKTIYKYLPIAVKDGKNKEAREKWLMHNMLQEWDLAMLD